MYLIPNYKCKNFEQSDDDNYFDIDLDRMNQNHVKFLNFSNIIDHTMNIGKVDNSSNVCNDCHLEKDIEKTNTLKSKSKKPTALFTSPNTSSKLKASDLNHLNKLQTINHKSLKKLSSTSFSNFKHLTNYGKKIDKIDKIENEIDTQLYLLKHGQPYYLNDNVTRLEKTDKPIPTLNIIYDKPADRPVNKPEQFEEFSTELIEQSYNPSTLYRLKKLQNNTPPEFLKRRSSTNLVIPTLDTEKSYVAKNYLDYSLGRRQFQAKIELDQPKSSPLVNQAKSSSSNFSCSDIEFENSDLSFSESGKPSSAKPAPLQRVKSVNVIMNPRFLHAPPPQAKPNNLSKICVKKNMQSNSTSQLIAPLKPQMSTFIYSNNKVFEIEKRKKLLTELDGGEQAADNTAANSNRSRANQSPSMMNRNGNQVRKGSIGNGQPGFNTITNRNNGAAAKKLYQEAFSINGKGVLAPESNSNFLNKNVKSFILTKVYLFVCLFL